jgi:hypothetical protein
MVGCLEPFDTLNLGSNTWVRFKIPGDQVFETRPRPNRSLAMHLTWEVGIEQYPRLGLDHDA